MKFRAGKVHEWGHAKLWSSYGRGWPLGYINVKSENLDLSGVIKGLWVPYGDITSIELADNGYVFVYFKLQKGERKHYLNPSAVGLLVWDRRALLQQLSQYTALTPPYSPDYSKGFRRLHHQFSVLLDLLTSVVATAGVLLAIGILIVNLARAVLAV